MRGLRTGLLVAGLVLLLDQATKALALAMLAGRPPIEVTGFFNLVLVWNRGVSFGMLQGLGDKGPWLLSAVPLPPEHASRSAGQSQGVAPPAPRFPPRPRRPSRQR